jgi:hypothetical protein
MTGTMTQIPLETISASGKPPETRLQDAQSARDILTKLVTADQLRNETRAKLRGLVDGNPPYNPAELRKNNQSYRTNVNFRDSEAFLMTAQSAFYDVFAEVPTYATVHTDFGTDPDKKDEWSKIITEEFDRLQKQDRDFDYLMQLSQREMVLIGCGPMIFEDATDWRCKSIMAGDLLVPDGTKSNVSDWKVACVRVRMGVDDMYEKIRDSEAASAVGWDVKAVQASIRQAMPEPYRSGQQYNWEWFQQQLRTNDISYTARCDVILLTHVFYREFDGKISHAIIDERGGDQFLYRKIGRFNRWEQVIHPMYYDRGDGQHYGVKGLGIKMLRAMELKNRLRCAMVDAAFARSQILFKPLNPNALNKTSVVQQGPYAIVPPDYDVVQQNISGVLDAPMAVNADIEGVLQNNLSQYRQTLNKPEGNPRTATEIQAIIAQQSAIGKTQLSRYYTQLDSFFEERFKRASNQSLTPTTRSEREALEFQRRCFERGVPKEALVKVDLVQATRTVGQGSQFAKQQLLGNLLGLLGTLPESGKMNLLKDYVAAQVGQQMVDRYLPVSQPSAREQDQAALAVLEHTSLKQGNVAVVTDTQDHTVHLNTHIGAANAAAASLQQGGNPQEIALFLQGITMHSQGHLERLQANPANADMVKQYVAQLREVQQVTVELGRMIEEQMQSAQAQQRVQAIQSGMDPETMILNAETQAAIQRDNAQALAKIQRDNAKAEADIVRKTAKTTSDINRSNAQAESQMMRQ